MHGLAFGVALSTDTPLGEPQVPFDTAKFGEARIRRRLRLMRCGLRYIISGVWKEIGTVKRRTNMAL
jgi:hypothetical protein